MKREPSIAEQGGTATVRRPRAGDRVSEAADHLFYTRGIRAVGVEEIVAQAGVTKPSLYRCFGSKDDLVVACLNARFAKVMDDVDALEAAHPDDPRALIRAIVAGVAAEMMQDDYRGCPVTNAAVEFPEKDHPTRLLALALKQRMRSRLIGITARLPTARSDMLADALILLLEGARASCHTACIAGPGAALIEAADALLAGFLLHAPDGEDRLAGASPSDLQADTRPLA